jgi:hypothetical protein
MAIGPRWLLISVSKLAAGNMQQRYVHRNSGHKVMLSLFCCYCCRSAGSVAEGAWLLTVSTPFLLILLMVKSGCCAGRQPDAQHLRQAHATLQTLACERCSQHRPVRTCDCIDNAIGVVVVWYVFGVRPHPLGLCHVTRRGRLAPWQPRERASQCIE